MIMAVTWSPKVLAYLVELLSQLLSRKQVIKIFIPEKNNFNYFKNSGRPGKGVGTCIRGVRGPKMGKNCGRSLRMPPQLTEFSVRGREGV